MYDINMFFPKFSRPSKAEVAFEVRKAYPNAIILYFDPAKNDPTKPLLFSGQEQWTRVGVPNTKSQLIAITQKVSVKRHIVKEKRKRWMRKKTKDLLRL